MSAEARRVICPQCHSQGSQRIKHHNLVAFRCPNGHITAWAHVYTPDMPFKKDQDIDWHESVAVVMIRPDNSVLFLQRNEFPYGLSVSLAHLIDAQEDPLLAAIRRSFEDTGIRLHPSAFIRIATDNIKGGRCLHGAEGHRLTTFVAKTPDYAKVTTSNKSSDYSWLALSQSLQQGHVVFATAYIIRKYQSAIRQAAAA